ncbi:hypothetical protein diail_2728 [Diaporthe ilicicola]|nr:hypothetical protein diail_2728 [Diaporthe ilicicola]
MTPFRRLTRFAFSRAKAVGQTRQPMRSFVAPKLPFAAIGAVVFELGYMFGSSKSGHGTIPLGIPLSLVPLNPTQSDDKNESQTTAARSTDDENDPKAAAYASAVQLAKHMTQEEVAISRLLVEVSKSPSNEGRLETKRRVKQLMRLYDAFWALHMVEFSHDTRVMQLLEKNAVELKQQNVTLTNAMIKARKAVSTGDTSDLEDYINKVLESNKKLLPGPPVRRPGSDLENFMKQVPMGSAVLSRLGMLQEIAAMGTEESKFLTEEVMYGLWWVLEKKAKEFDQVARK